MSLTTCKVWWYVCVIGMITSLALIGIRSYMDAPLITVVHNIANLALFYICYRWYNRRWKLLVIKQQD